MVIFVDIDETICETKGDLTKPRDYKNAKPLQENINKINDLYDNGHEVVYWTARGARTGINWYHTTKRQLDEWGARYTELKMGKPFYDLLIDDKALTTVNEASEVLK